MSSHRNPQGSTIFHIVPSISMKFHKVRVSQVSKDL